MNQFERYRKIKQAKEEIKKTNYFQSPELDFSLITTDKSEFIVGVIDNVDGHNCYVFKSSDIHSIKNYDDIQSLTKEQADYFDECIESYILKCLCGNYEPIFISLNLHFSIWEYIDANLHEIDEVFQPGVQQYLKYCLDTGINKRLLDNYGTTLFPDLIWIFLFHEDPLDEVFKRIATTNILLDNEAAHG